MSTNTTNPPPLDYGAWTRRNFPNLTGPERNLLLKRLLEARPSPALLQELVAIPAPSRAAILAVLSSIKASWQAAGLSTADDTQGVCIARMKPPEPGKD